MKDKETKEWIREQIEGIEAYDYSATTNGIMEAIERLEQEAERRGLEKALGFIIGEGNISWAKDKIVESIKLLEEENGEQE